MTTTLVIIGLLCALVAVLPARYDPAIRLVEWLRTHERKSDR